MNDKTPFDTQPFELEAIIAKIDPHPATKGPVIFQNPDDLRTAADMIRILAAQKEAFWSRLFGKVTGRA